MENLIYLDNNATTPVDPRVIEAIMPFLTDNYGNTASRHVLGSRAHQAVKEARATVADLIGCENHEIIFTSGATEAINMGIKGTIESLPETKKNIVTVSTEHPAVIDTCKYLQKKNVNVTFLPVQKDGLLDLNVVRESITRGTGLVCVMHVNNETGVIQPIKQISEIAHENGAFFMTDATQSAGKIEISVNNFGIDLLSISAHKFYGVKGIGALYIRSRRPNKVNPIPILHGGGHERELRSGTLNVPGIVAMGTAAEIAKKEMRDNQDKILKLRDLLENSLLEINDSFVNGNTENRIYNTTNICFKGADADAIIASLGNVMVSNGSACSTAKVEPSHVLLAMGLSSKDAYSSVRFSLGKFNEKNEIESTVRQITKIVSYLRNMGNLS